MSITKIICSKSWESKGANINIHAAKDAYYPEAGVIFTPMKTPGNLHIPKTPILAKPPISSTPTDIAYVQFTISGGTGKYPEEYKAAFQAAKFYQFGEVLVSEAMIVGKVPPGAADKTSVSIVMSVYPVNGEWVMLARYFWSDHTIGSYWCC